LDVKNIINFELGKKQATAEEFTRTGWWNSTGLLSF